MNKLNASATGVYLIAVTPFTDSGELDLASTAHDIFDAYLPLARYEQQPNVGLAVRKHILKERGVIASSAVRKPGPKLTPLEVDDIARLTTRQPRRLREIA